ncbi:MAG: transcription elongation factor GreA [Bacteroidota bacterium]
MPYYTVEGLQKIKEELRRLKTEERSRVAEQLSDARSQGDLSENAEYDAAKDAQRMLEHRIAKLEEVILHARVISREQINTSIVSILATVKIRSTGNDQEATYTLVAEEEANLKLGKLSVDSPLGRGLLGKKLGETVVIEAPSGKLSFEIQEIRNQPEPSQ